MALFQEHAVAATKAFEVGQDAITVIAPNIPPHREVQREVIKRFMEAQRVFHLRAAAVIEEAQPYL